MAIVDPVANGLAHQVVADRPHAESVTGQQIAATLAVRRVRERRPDVEMVAPARELQPVVPPCGGLFGQDVKGQIGPLAGEKGHRAAHGDTPLTRGRYLAIPTHRSAAADASTQSMKCMPQAPSTSFGKSWSSGSASAPAIPAPITLPAHL